MQYVCVICVLANRRVWMYRHGCNLPVFFPPFTVSSRLSCFQLPSPLVNSQHTSQRSLPCGSQTICPVSPHWLVQVWSPQCDPQANTKLPSWSIAAMPETWLHHTQGLHSAPRGPRWVGVTCRAPAASCPAAVCPLCSEYSDLQRKQAGLLQVPFVNFLFKSCELAPSVTTDYALDTNIFP